MIVKYRLPNDTIMTDKKFGPLMDAQQAIRVVRERAQELSIDPNKIGVIGFSAGGHLAASLCNHYSDTLYPAINFSSRPDFAALVYAVISFADSMTHSGSITNLLGINPDSKWVKYFSNELQVTSNTPPTFLVHAGDDKSVSVENSILYFEALQRAGVKSELHIYQTGGHGFGSGRGGTENGWRTAFENWINALYPNEKSKQK
jgi:acetyl esterase/lipase